MIECKRQVGGEHLNITFLIVSFIIYCDYNKHLKVILHI